MNSVKGMPWQMCKNIVARQTKTCREARKNKQGGNVTFKGNIESPVLKEAFFKAQENSSQWSYLNENTKSTTPRK